MIMLLNKTKRVHHIPVVVGTVVVTGPPLAAAAFFLSSFETSAESSAWFLCNVLRRFCRTENPKKEMQRRE